MSDARFLRVTIGDVKVVGSNWIVGLTLCGQACMTGPRSHVWIQRTGPVYEQTRDGDCHQQHVEVGERLVDCKPVPEEFLPGHTAFYAVTLVFVAIAVVGIASTGVISRFGD